MKRIVPTLALGLFGCGAGTGSAKFTTWGEAYIEDGIPAGDEGFVDGWSIRYEKFLVAFHGISVAASDGAVGATMEGSKLVDNVVRGRKDLVEFDGLEARAWDRVGYQIKPATASSELVGATAEDRDRMVANGWSIYVSGTASTGTVSKSFAWGFALATQYHDCLQPAESGAELEGIVVVEGSTDVSELTTHGDHFFYDRLKASPDPAVMTSLRFAEKAAADADGDGAITLEELRAAPIDVRRYDPSGFDAPTLGAFVTALGRTVGHFRGEGECSLSAL